MDFFSPEHWWWQILPVPVLTFILALAGSWWGARLGRTTEHWQWLRNEKQKIYVTILDQLEGVLERIPSLIEGKPSDKELQAYEAQDLTSLKILGPGKLTERYISIISKILQCLTILEEGSSDDIRARAQRSYKDARDETNNLIGLIRADLKIRG